MKTVRITKVSDDAFGGNHPNGINQGYTASGFELNGKPTIGYRYHVGDKFSTSIVVAIISKTTFKTLYSTYKLKYMPSTKKKK